jgi:hypothetical protein
MKRNLLVTLKHLLSKYEDCELVYMSLWIDGNQEVAKIVIDEFAITLIQSDTELKVNDNVF